jgi:hypothetical protein
MRLTKNPIPNDTDVCLNITRTASSLVMHTLIRCGLDTGQITQMPESQGRGCTNTARTRHRTARVDKKDVWQAHWEQQPSTRKVIRQAV